MLPDCCKWLFFNCLRCDAGIFCCLVDPSQFDQTNLSSLKEGEFKSEFDACKYVEKLVTSAGEIEPMNLSDATVAVLEELKRQRVEGRQIFWKMKVFRSC